MEASHTALLIYNIERVGNQNIGGEQNNSGEIKSISVSNTTDHPYHHLFNHIKL